MDVATKFASG
jgi:hypothetical protein